VYKYISLVLSLCRCGAESFNTPTLLAWYRIYQMSQSAIRDNTYVGRFSDPHWDQCGSGSCNLTQCRSGFGLCLQIRSKKFKLFLPFLSTVNFFLFTNYSMRIPYMKLWMLMHFELKYIKSWHIPVLFTQMGLLRYVHVNTLWLYVYVRMFTYVSKYV
jgi:hypothetical protein